MCIYLILKITNFIKEKKNRKENYYPAPKKIIDNTNNLLYIFPNNIRAECSKYYNANRAQGHQNSRNNGR